MTSGADCDQADCTEIRRDSRPRATDQMLHLKFFRPSGLDPRQQILDGFHHGLRGCLPALQHVSNAACRPLARAILMSGLLFICTTYSRSPALTVPAGNTGFARSWQRTHPWRTWRGSCRHRAAAGTRRRPGMPEERVGPPQRELKLARIVALRRSIGCKRQCGRPELTRQPRERSGRPARTRHTDGP